jgi:hypothetical protein
VPQSCPSVLPIKHFLKAILDSCDELNGVQVDVLQMCMTWADMNPLSCYGTNNGAKALAEMIAASPLGLTQLQKMMHTFVSGLIEKKLLAEDAVVVVLGKAPWSCCKDLGSLLPKLEVHQVHHRSDVHWNVCLCSLQGCAYAASHERPK